MDASNYPYTINASILCRVSFLLCFYFVISVVMLFDVKLVGASSTSSRSIYIRGLFLAIEILI